MKILHVISGLGSNAGGTSEFVPNLCRELLETNIETSLVAIDWKNGVSEATKKAAAAGVKIHLYELTSTYGPFRPLAYSIGLDRGMKQLIAAADIVHLHGLWQWPCWKAAKEAKSQNKPYVFQAHGFLEPERLKKSVLKKKLFGMLFERRMLNGAARVIATAPSEVDSLTQYGVTRPIEIVPIGIDTKEIDGAQRDLEVLKGLGVPEGKRILLFLSRLAPIKGLDMLAEAWEKMEEYHNDWQLVIAGAGDRGYEKDVQTEFSRRILDKSVSFIGPVYGSDKFVLLKSADAFVLPTRSENFSIAVQEALASGVPVVCTKGAPWKAIEHEGCGYWVDISAQGIQDGLRKILSLSDSERRIFAENGKSYVQRNFSWTEIALSLKNLYLRVLNEHK